jgi:hypothetical protein
MDITLIEVDLQGQSDLTELSVKMEQGVRIQQGVYPCVIRKKVIDRDNKTLYD